MKTANNIRSNGFKIITAPAIFATLFLLLIVTGKVQANDTTKKAPAEITYVGSVDQKPVFQIDFDNPEGDEVYLFLKDESGNMIYSEVVKEKKYSRKIALDISDVNNLKMILTLRSKKNYQTQTFQVNKSVRLVEDVKIAQL